LPQKFGNVKKNLETLQRLTKITMKTMLKQVSLCLGLLAALSFAHAQSYTAYTAEIEIGSAAYYGDHLIGQTTASGEYYRPEAFTASHATYPLGTVLRVTRLDNNQTVEVRVNDRKPRSQETVITLSKAAAAQLGMIATGRTQVRVERIISAGGNNPLPASTLTARSPIASAPTSYAASNTPSAYVKDTPRPAASAASQADWEGQLFRDEKYAPSRRSDQLQARGVSSPSTANARNQDLPSNFSWNDNVRPRGIGNASAAPAAPSAANANRLLPAGASGYAIQLASYSTLENAASHAQRLVQQGFDGAYVWQKDGRNRVVIAAFPSRPEASNYLTLLRQQHQLDGLVVAL
jgi:rare lipoprotein A